MRARQAFFDFCVHRFTISPQTAHDQRIACEGFTCKAFTQSSPFPSPQPSLYELVRSEVKGEHRKSKLGEVRIRDRDVCAGACPRDENTAAGEGENRKGETKEREVRNDSVRLPRRRANSVRAIEKCATKTKKLPCFVTNLPTFSKKTSRFRRGFSGGTTKCSAFSRSSAQSARRGGEIHYISLALPPKSFIFAGKHLLRRPPCAALPHRYEETAVSPPQCRGLFPHGQRPAHG